VDASIGAALAALARENAPRIFLMPPPFTEDDPPRYDAELILGALKLGNGTLRALGETEKELPVAVSPGPNLAWFDLGARGAGRSHLWARAVLDACEPAARVCQGAPSLRRQVRGAYAHGDWRQGERAVRAFGDGLFPWLDIYRALVAEKAFEGENLDSLREAVSSARERLAHAGGAGDSPERAERKGFALAPLAPSR
jgi:hypothetical protein